MYLADPYYQGETIGFYIEGDSVIDLDGNPFKVEFYNAAAKSQKVVIDKSEMTSVSVNKYYAEISNTISAGLQVGNYIVEQLYGENYTSIKAGEAFTLLFSDIKSEL